MYSSLYFAIGFSCPFSKQPAPNRLLIVGFDARVTGFSAEESGLQKQCHPVAHPVPCAIRNASKTRFLTDRLIRAAGSGFNVIHRV
jgi:hypothetical protein